MEYPVEYPDDAFPAGPQDITPDMSPAVPQRFARRSGPRRAAPTLQSSVRIQSDRVFRRWDYIVFGLLTAVTWAALARFLIYWFSLEDWRLHPISFWGLTLVLFAFVGINQFRWFLLPAMRKPRPIPPAPGLKVGVFIPFVPDGESFQMLQRTVTAIAQMDYPHETWVLDEGDCNEVKALCQRLGAHHFTRKNKPLYQQPEGKFQARHKVGNVNAWLYEAAFDRYDILVGFDSDHVPDRSFLNHVLGYFSDPEVGYVQLPQVYYNQKASFIARGAAEETYAYYSSTQMAIYAAGYPIINGCHQSHRAEALKQAGGFPAHDADDLLITLIHRTNGWRGIFVPEILAWGLTPVDWEGYMKQQVKWARSTLDIKFRIYPRMAGKLPLMERILSLLHGLYYLQGLNTGFWLVMMGLMLATGLVPRIVSYTSVPQLGMLFLVLVLCGFYRQRFYLNPKREWGFHWRAIINEYAKWPYLLVALWDVIWNRKRPFPLTRKDGATRRRRLALLLPQGLIAAFVAVCWVIGMLLHPARIQPVLHMWAGIIFAASILLILTELLLDYPPPYDDALFTEQATYRNA